MTSTYFFSPLFRSNTQADTAKALNSGRKKRKRGDTDDSTDEHDRTGSPGPIEERLSATHDSYNALREAPFSANKDTSNEGIHYPFPYPHKPQFRVKKSCAPLELTRELANLKPPLNPPAHYQSTAISEHESTSLKQRHLAVLTTILHKCLLQGEYIRAGRVWGLLLRAEVNGESMNIRANGMWGLGAEILLQRDLQQRQRDTRSQSLDVPAKSGNNAERGDLYGKRASFTNEGFEIARAYYERLILQYPSRKWLPNSLSSLHFYPVLFGLWICHVQDQHVSALDRLPPIPTNRSDGESGSEENDRQRDFNNRENLRKPTLQSAGVISGRLDELLRSFPYSDSAMLWGLRGLVSLWIGDLTMISTIPYSGTESASEVLISEPSPAEEELEVGFAKRMTLRNDKSAYDVSLNERRAHLQKADQAFSTAELLKEQKGHTMTDTVLEGPED
ncbi:hypothetical protein MMC13_007236 [Lambiella insularis]|nr:hypothetical protein [Lambiella insularis]